MLSSALSDYFAQRKIPLLALGPSLLLPAEFSSVEQEYWAVRRSVGIFDFSFMSTVELVGSDALALLKLIQNRDCEKLAIGKIAYSMLLNENGEVWLDATVWRLGPEHFYLITGSAILSFLLAAARPYSNLRLLEISEQYQVIAVQGRHSSALLETVLGLKASDLPQYFAFNRPLRYPSLLIARLGYTGELGYELLVPRAEAITLWQQLQAIATLPALECGFLAANILRIEAGFILFSNELTKPRTLAALGKLFGAASESGAAGLQTKLVGLHFPQSAKAINSEVNFDRDLGQKIELTSHAFSPQLGYEIGLGFSSQAVLVDGPLNPQARHVAVLPGGSNLGPVYIEKLPFSGLCAKT